MGTRNLTCVVHGGQFKIAQYGQFDGYPAGQGSTILEFLHKFDRAQFEKKLALCRFANDVEDHAMLVALGKNWLNKYPQMSREIAGEILQFVMGSDGELLLQDKSIFAADSVMCEWAYVVDLDKNVFEIYKGFNKSKAVGRFAEMEMPEWCHKEYFQVTLLKSYHLSELPTRDQFIADLVPQEEE
jgi:hypothetical protein